jgi:hypothetical protein
VAVSQHFGVVFDREIAKAHAASGISTDTA